MIRTAIGGLVTVEIFFCFIITAPYGTELKKKVLDVIPFKALFLPCLFIFGFVAITGVSALWDYYASASRTGAVTDGDYILKLNSEIDAILAGFAISMGLLLNANASNLRTINRLEKSVEAMAKQAKQASDFHANESAAYDQLKEGLSKVKKSESGDLDAEALLRSIADSNAALKKKDLEVKGLTADLEAKQEQALKEKNAEIKKLSANFKAMESQARSQSETFKSLMKEKNRLEVKLEDYEMVLSDARKKAV